MALFELITGVPAGLEYNRLESCREWGKNGKLFILTGMSASGKDATLRKMVDEWHFQRVVSSTTRPMRDGEIDGVDYNFISRKEFQDKINKNEFLEYRSYNTCVSGKDDVWYYGCTKQNLDIHENYVVVLDMQGAKSFIDYYGTENCFVVYVSSDDRIREKRASQRGSFDKTEWDRRLADDKIKFSDKILANNVNFIVGNNAMDTIDNVACDIILAGRKYFISKEKEPTEDFFIDYNSDFKNSLFNAVTRTQILKGMEEWEEHCKRMEEKWR